MKKTDPNYGIKSFSSYDTITYKSYLWFSKEPTYKVIDAIRKDGWIYDVTKDKWRCRVMGKGSYGYVKKFQRKLFDTYGITPMN